MTVSSPDSISATAPTAVIKLAAAEQPAAPAPATRFPGSDVSDSSSLYDVPPQPLDLQPSELGDDWFQQISAANTKPNTTLREFLEENERVDGLAVTLPRWIRTLLTAPSHLKRVPDSEKISPRADSSDIATTLTALNFEATLEIPLKELIDISKFARLDLVATRTLPVKFLTRDPEIALFISTLRGVCKGENITITAEGSNFSTSKLWRKLIDWRTNPDLYARLAVEPTTAPRSIVFWLIYRYVGRAQACEFLRGCVEYMRAKVGAE